MSWIKHIAPTWQVPFKDHAQLSKHPRNVTCAYKQLNVLSEKGLNCTHRKSWHTWWALWTWRAIFTLERKQKHHDSVKSFKCFSDEDLSHAAFDKGPL